ncbi:unnamed protein product [Protopolystoma xenopodis]|uniref:Vacuolar protein sorting-associated protein 29 n=1 Tax=Protopolystoma xenopodis TaxID=117903 RepID=A0A3S5BY35_9PLAT|nr:unnamed protein product [Protopolystoma xenopodis]
MKKIFLVLVIGDFHIPDRKHSLHPTFKNLLAPGKIKHILCTGNLTSRSVYDYLRIICCDGLDFPETKVMTVGKFKIGLTHGHQIIPWGDRDSLAIFQRQLDVDILIYGHTHRFETFEHDGNFFINPGSATGASSALERQAYFYTYFSSHRPSFVLLDIQDSVIELYVYRLFGSEHKVERIEFRSSYE